MARYTGPKTKIARKFGEAIFKEDKSFERKNYPPGQHGVARRRAKRSEYAIQLQEKQKAKYTYGYWAAGGLDGRFFAHNEEIDLCWRLYQMGKRIFCFPESYVYHVGGGTLPKSNPRKTFLNFRNNLTMLWKNLPEDELKHVMRVRWFLDYLAAFQTLILNHNWGEFKAIFSARRAFKKWRHEFERLPIRLDGVVKHRENLPSCTNDGRKKYALLWQYYVKGRKVFSSLSE